jgi:hypothetical protein
MNIPWTRQSWQDSCMTVPNVTQMQKSSNIVKNGGFPLLKTSAWLPQSYMQNTEPGLPKNAMESRIRKFLMPYPVTLQEKKR